MAPIVATWLLDVTGGYEWIAMIAVSLFCTLALTETSTAELLDGHPRARTGDASLPPGD